MPDSTPNDSSPTEPLSYTAEQGAPIQSAKPLAPRPRPAFTRKSKPPAAAGIDLSDIPEAVPLDDIPEGIPLPAQPTSQSRPQSGTMARPEMRTPGNRPIRPKSTPQNRAPADYSNQQQEEVVERVPIDKSKLATFDKYERGDTAVKPLEKLPGVESRQVQRLEKPKFLDGELSRSVERGVQYPLPGRVIFTSLALLLFKFVLVTTVIVMPLVAIFAEASMTYAIALPIALVLSGIIFAISANRTRCRICSCHMFFNRRCFKHQKAHRVFGLGHGGSAALHGLLFKWLRCMYCGTAIRLRAAKEDSDEAESRRVAESQKPNYDKSLVKPRAPR